MPSLGQVNCGQAYHQQTGLSLRQGLCPIRERSSHGQAEEIESLCWMLCFKTTLGVCSLSLRVSRPAQAWATIAHSVDEHRNWVKGVSGIWGTRVRVAASMESEEVDELKGEAA